MRHLKSDGDLHFCRSAAIRFNAQSEHRGAPLMRILIDVHGLPWDEASRITVGTLSYTNHAAPEVLKPAAAAARRVLPHRDHLMYQRAAPAAGAKDRRPGAGRISRIDEHGSRRVRMGHLAFVGRTDQRRPALHTDLMRKWCSANCRLSGPDRQQDQRHPFCRWPMQRSG